MPEGTETACRQSNQTQMHFWWRYRWSWQCSPASFGWMKLSAEARSRSRTVIHFRTGTRTGNLSVLNRMGSGIAGRRYGCGAEGGDSLPRSLKVSSVVPGFVWCVKETDGRQGREEYVCQGLEARNGLLARSGRVERWCRMCYKKGLTCKHLGYRFIVAIQQG